MTPSQRREVEDDLTYLVDDVFYVANFLLDERPKLARRLEEAAAIVMQVQEELRADEKVDEEK